MSRRGLAIVGVMGDHAEQNVAPANEKVAQRIDSPYLDSQGAVRYLQLRSLSGLYNLMREHGCPFLRMGGRLRFDKRDLDRWMHDQSARIELHTRKK